MAEVRTEQGKLYMFVAIDWTAKISMQINEMARYRAENPQLPRGFADGV